MTLLQGQILNNRYKIVKQIGQGGFGAVYSALDTRMDFICVIKENHETSPEASHQFIREAQILFKLKHPGLPLVHDYFEVTGSGLYLVMELVEGQNLSEIVSNRGTIQEDEALKYIIQVCEALEYLHHQNPPVIHRDIKPHNIIITPEGKAVLVDFGVAKAYQANQKTTLGARAATPGFSPPEQYLLTGTDVRSDIYSLGATLYNLLTGQIPPESVARLMHKKLPLILLYQPEVSWEIIDVVNKAMAIQPHERYDSIIEFQKALSALLPPVTTQNLQQKQLTDSIPLPAKSSAIQHASPAMRTKQLSPNFISPPTNPTVTSTHLTAQTNIPGNKIIRGWKGLMIIVVIIVVSILLISILPSALILVPSSSQAMSTDTPMIKTSVITKTLKLTITPTKTISTRLRNKDGMVELYIPAGQFIMGADGNYVNEKPAHKVYLDTFWIDQTEVTNNMFAAFLNSEGNQYEGGVTWFKVIYDNKNAHLFQNNGVWIPIDGFENHPVVGTNWFGASAYCTWVGSGLPTEAQWEKAARGTEDIRFYPWGNTIGTAGYANYDSTQTVSVGRYLKSASPYGVMDMAGNVWEWVSDWFGEYPIEKVFNPTGPNSGFARVLRGGSYTSNQFQIMSVIRYGKEPQYSDNEIGFRCAH